MGEYTKNLKLFKYKIPEDNELSFSIERALNENWDKLDEEFSKRTAAIDNQTIGIDENGSMYLKAFPHYSTGDHMLLNLGGQGSQYTKPPHGNYELDFSSYIPNDGYSYLVYIGLMAAISDTNAMDRFVRIYDESETKTYGLLTSDGTTGSVNNPNCVSTTAYLPSTSRKLIAQLANNPSTNQGDPTSYPFQQVIIWLFWWQRIGKG